MTEKKTAEESASPKTGGKANESGEKPAINKMEAVRRAMRSLGNEAKRGEIQNFVWDEFGIDMDLDHISSYKGDIIRKAAQTSEPAAKPAAPKSAPAKKEPAPAEKPEVGITLESIQAARELIEQLGADQARNLIDVLAK